MNQCLGTTTKGIRCKLKTADKYCHYHTDQAGNTRRSSPVKTPPSVNRSPIRSSPIRSPAKPGYIYVYTMTRLLTHDKLPWLNVKNLPNARNKKWVAFNSKSSPYILIKVGMTTQTVSKRIQQWRDKCHHDLTVLIPGQKFSQSSWRGLVAKFKNLSIDPPMYRTYQNDGFYSEKDIRLVESEVHKQLRKRYGYGDLLCVGCEKTGTSRSGGPFSGEYNIHVEWFLVPKSELSWVYGVIDSVASGSSAEAR